MLAYIQARLCEHSTQLALSADFTALLAAISGQAEWKTTTTIILGSLPAILFPSSSAPKT